MALSTAPDSSARQEVTRLAWAFGLSIALHLLVFGSFQAGQKLGWWQRIQWPDWLKSSRLLSEKIKKQKVEELTTAQEIPLTFVEVNPAHSTPEPPKEAKYYSDKNAVAANPEPDQHANVPKIDGKNPELVKTETVPREILSPVLPAPAPQPETKQEQEEVKAAATEKPGDLTLKPPDLNPNPSPAPDPGEAKPAKQKMTVAEAKARQREQQMPGEKMKQDGGVEHRRVFATLDTKSTIYGHYDTQLIRLIQKSWYDLLDEQGYASDYRGKVVLQFDLHYDGSLSGLKVVENTAGSMPGFLCETAVDKPKPYNRFPPDMRRVVGDTRHMQFTFFYN